MVLNKRLKREFGSNWIRYTGLFILVVLSVSLIVGFADSTDSILYTVKSAGEEKYLEDGNFQVAEPLTTEQKKHIEASGFILAEDFYYDKEINKGQILRLFKYREELNLLSITEGSGITSSKAAAGREIVLNKHFGETNGYKIGSKISVENQEFTVTGYGITPDYTLVLKDNSDTLADSTLFGIGFISEKDFNSIEKKDIFYGYSFRLKKNTFSETISESEKKEKIQELKQYLKDNQSVITSFYKTADNQRTASYSDDIAINKSIALILGTILLFLLAYIFTLSSLHIIDKESPVIGALYALGYVKKDIIRHFMILPVFLVTLAAVLGTVVGFQVFTPFVASSSYAYYSYPNMHIVYPPYLLFFGIIAPVFITAIVNYFILSRRLHYTPLKLLRKDTKKDRLKKVQLYHFTFINRFRIRVFLKGLDGNLTLFCGLLFSTFLLLMGFGVKDAIDSYVTDVGNNTPSEYTYILKQPIELSKPGDGEKAVTVSMETYYSVLDQNMKITLQGIGEDSEYFNYSIKNGDKGVYISKAVSKKFSLKTGDTLELTDAEKDITYQLPIAGIVNYTAGLYAFMNQQELNKLIGNKEDYFNTYFSNQSLELKEDFVYSEVTTGDTQNTAQNMSRMMKPMINLLVVVAILLYIVIMYLLLKMLIDKNASNISLIKIFGYNQKEIHKVYLGSTFYTVLVSVILALPIDYQLFSAIWPECISNIQGFIFIKIKPVTYGVIFLIAIASYLVTQELLKLRLKKISYVDVLKERE